MFLLISQKLQKTPALSKLAVFKLTVISIFCTKCQNNKISIIQRNIMNICQIFKTYSNITVKYLL